MQRDARLLLKNFFSNSLLIEQVYNNENIKDTISQSLKREKDNDLIENAEIEPDGRISFSYERDDRQSFGFTRESFGSNFTDINYDVMDEEQLVRYIAYNNNNNNN